MNARVGNDVGLERNNGGDGVHGDSVDSVARDGDYRDRRLWDVVAKSLLLKVLTPSS